MDRFLQECEGASFEGPPAATQSHNSASCLWRCMIGLVVQNAATQRPESRILSVALHGRPGGTECCYTEARIVNPVLHGRPSCIDCCHTEARIVNPVLHGCTECCHTEP